MKLNNSCKKLPSTPLTLSGKQLASQWLQQGRKPRATKSPNYISIACRAFKLMLDSQHRIMRLAPLLFDDAAINRRVNRELRALIARLGAEGKHREKTGKLTPWAEQWTMLAEVPDPLAYAQARLRSEITASAWQELPVEKRKQLEIQWQLYSLAFMAGLRAFTLSKKLTDPSSLNLSSIMNLMVTGLKMGQTSLRWRVPQALQANLDASTTLSADLLALMDPAAAKSPVQPGMPAAARNIIQLRSLLTEMPEEPSDASPGETSARAAM